MPFERSNALSKIMNRKFDALRTRGSRDVGRSGGQRKEKDSETETEQALEPV